jgi:hypothetical protein
VIGRGLRGMSKIKRFLWVFWALLPAATPGFAQSGTSCALTGPTYQLASDIVVWSMTVGSGQSCIRGIRSAYVTLDDIKLVTPPQSGQVVLEGPGFVYKGSSDFRGEDSFAISVSGTLNRIPGNSTIRVEVYVR